MAHFKYMIPLTMLANTANIQEPNTIRMKIFETRDSSFCTSNAVLVRFFLLSTFELLDVRWVGASDDIDSSRNEYFSDAISPGDVVVIGVVYDSVTTTPLAML